MAPDRRYVLAAIVVALGVVAGAIILDVLGTAVFAITVAYVLVPVHRWLTRRGLTPWWAAAVSSLLAFVGAIVVFSPIFVTLYLRRDALFALMNDLPSSFTVTVLDSTYVLQASDVQAQAVSALQDLAISFAGALPVLAIKFALFGTLLFAILLKGDAAVRAGIAPVPHGYRSVVYALATRARETLYAIYVLQLATGVGTLVIAYPLFWALGYENALILALLSGLLQFVPIVGPSLIVLALAGYQFALGDPTSGAVVGVLGLVLIGWLPDVLIRPRLARRSAGLPGSLYFVGFTGGLFTLGPIGIVVGPLVIAVFVEAVELLAAEVNADDLEAFEPLADSFVPEEDAGDAAATAGDTTSSSAPDGADTADAAAEAATDGADDAAATGVELATDTEVDSSSADRPEPDGGDAVASDATE